MSQHEHPEQLSEVERMRAEIIALCDEVQRPVNRWYGWFGGLWRSAHAFGASMIFTVAFRPPRQPTDTSKAARYVPLMQWDDWDEFLDHRPDGCDLVAVETDDAGARAPRSLPDFTHPERAMYVLGAEDKGLPRSVLACCEHMVEIPTGLCLNVATAGSVVMYDRKAKGYR